ncbi:MAG: hypothetical protein ABR518_06960 [Actinomycetota bacterium]
MRTSESDVREMLERRARDFDMSPAPAPNLLRMARRNKRARTSVLVGLAALVLAGAVGSIMSGLDGMPRRRPVVATGRAGSADRPVRLVSYALRDSGSPEDPPAAQNDITADELREHAECMRAYGFDVPDPTEGPNGHWSIIVDDPKGSGLDPGSEAFREAMFVTCGPLGGPLSGDIVVAGPRETVDRFIACMSDQGFDLPEPTTDSGGGDDTDEWEFDLDGTGIDTSTSDWNRAMFVTCSPAQM